MEYQIKELSLEELEQMVQRMPVRHDGLSEEQLALAAYTYRAVGKYQCNTLEQWELGFMRDMHPDQELVFWMRVALVCRKLKRSQFSRGEIVAELCYERYRPPHAPQLPIPIKKAWQSITSAECESAVRDAFTEAGFEIDDDEDGCEGGGHW